MYRATIRITLRPSILDPQGKAMQHALHNLGYGGITSVRAGKFVEVLVDTEDRDEAERVAREACQRLLANPVMEDFEVDIAPVGASSNA
jgi:phosphoribosylformylglycinamidine synthase subunit PurS